MKKKVRQKGSFLGYHSNKLTKTEKEVLFFWTKEFLTIQQIANRRGTTKRAVQKTFQKLRKKGILNEKNMVRTKRVCGIHLNAKKIRFHGLEFNIKLLFKDYRYKKILAKSNILEVDGNTIRLFNDAIEVYVNHSFYGDSVSKARKDGFDYSYQLFYRLENDLKVLIVKPRSQNIKLVKQHFAEVNNELAEDMNSKNEKLQIRGVDGKVWLLVDNSKNLNELEAVHPVLAEKDMESVIKPFFDDLRKNPVTSSVVLGLLKETNVNVREVSAGLVDLMKLLHPNLMKEENSVKKKTVFISKPSYVG